MGRSRGDEISSALLGAKPVSELRFNIPGSDLSGGANRDSNNLSGRFGKLLHHRSQSSDEDWEDDDGDNWDDDDEDGNYNTETPMDLSLGKELAGGGNTGKRAKLGKLIVHDEGLKMLDLVVAANVGVWWTSWGRML
jgi:NADH dehydrogenase (ubiquinone) Fe-S protein 8